MKLATETLEAFSEALDNASEDLENGQSARDECEDIDRAIIDAFPAIVAAGTVESVACSFVALEWLKNQMIDRRERAQYATRRPELGTKEQNEEERTTYRALLKDYRAALKYAAQLDR